VRAAVRTTIWTRRRSVWPAAVAASVTAHVPGAIAVHSVEAAPDRAKLPQPAGLLAQARIGGTGPPARPCKSIRSPATTELRGAAIAVTTGRWMPAGAGSTV